MGEVPFWLTDEGIRMRLADLAHLVITRTFNGCIQTNAADFGIEGMRYRTSGLDNVCGICKPRENKVYKPGQFMPNLPAHNGCACYFDAILGTVQPGVE